MSDELNQVIRSTLETSKLADGELAKVIVEVNYKEGNTDAVFNALTDMAKDEHTKELLQRDNTIDMPIVSQRHRNAAAVSASIHHTLYVIKLCLITGLVSIVHVLNCPNVSHKYTSYLETYLQDFPRDFAKSRPNGEKLRIQAVMFQLLVNGSFDVYGELVEGLE
ncbi:hypothetical protein FXO37_31768 [Capsicum annuum]|nr:hypothetical protein FXO37_31768 [Capsicum annuum]